jgi:hypothetical protein
MSRASAATVRTGDNRQRAETKNRKEHQHMTRAIRGVNELLWRSIVVGAVLAAAVVGGGRLALAASQGPNSPSLSVAPNGLANPNNAFSSNDVYATGAGNQGYRGFGFIIPAGATIQGIEVQLEGNAASCARTQKKLKATVSNGTDTSTEKVTADYGSGDTSQTLGGPADLWGLAWTPTTINGNLKVVVITQCTGGSASPNSLSLDHVSVTVYFSAGLSITATKDFRHTDVDFFPTEGDFFLGTPLSQDGEGNYLASVVLGGSAHDRVSSTNPGQLYEVIALTSESGEFDSVNATMQLPINWALNPAPNPQGDIQPGAVHVFFLAAGATELVEITDAAVRTYTAPTGTLVCGGGRGVVSVSIADLPGSPAGQPLAPGDQMFIFVKLQYDLKGETVDPAEDYPCVDTDQVGITAFTEPEGAGDEASDDATATLIVSVP